MTFLEVEIAIVTIGVTLMAILGWIALLGYWVDKWK
jgi:hypothetical protein